MIKNVNQHLINIKQVYLLQNPLSLQLCPKVFMRLSYFEILYLVSVFLFLHFVFWTTSNSVQSLLLIPQSWITLGVL